MKRFTTIISILVMAATSFAQNHFNVAWSGFGNEHMNFYVVTATIGGVDLEAGDEIAVFDGSICCGAAVLTSAIDVSDINTFAAIVASKIDEGKLNGYTTGNAITYKIWDASKNMEISGITAEYFKNNGQATTEPAYTPNVTALVKLSVATPANQAPVANAGTDQTVDEGALVTLDGSASSDADSNPLTYKWTAPAGISLSSDTDQKPTFTAPEVTADTDYTFSLVVNDGTVDSSADEVKITVKQVNKAPVANAGSDQSVNEGATVSLDGSASSDADSDPLTYKWTAPAGITLSSDTDQKPTFTAPEVTTDTEYTFSLVVNDGTADSPADEVIITVKQVNKIPEANAGNDQVVNKNETVTLDGSASSDADNDPLTYQWTAPAGITLSSVTAEKPTFTAPDVLVNTDYTFSLIVNDGTADSPADEVKITVKFVNQAPTANAGDDQTVNEGVEVTLNGSASTDPDGNTLSYKWTAPATITLSSTSAEKPTFTAPEVTADTEYTFSLVVNDGTADSPADQVKITVKQVNKVPVANAGNDQTVNEGATVSLDGSASSDADSDALTYKWTAPAGISLSSDTDQKPTFTAPEVSADTEYIFSLVVNDGTSDSPADQVKITVKQINKVPVAIAGNDRTVLKGTTVILDGSGSSDPDGDVLSYKWTAPAGITLSSNTAEKPTFTAPDVLTNTDYTFSLIVNDGTADSPADEVKITVKSGNQAPTANAGNDQTVNEGDEVTLDGSASSDPDGNALTYKWTGPAGITLSSNTAEKPTFTAPDVASNTSFTFSLVVNDGIADSPADDVVITVKQVGQAPTANAGPDQTVNEGDLVTLDASGSSNPENKATAIEWSAPGTIQLNDPILIKVVVTGPSYTSTSSHDYSLMLYDASPGATPGNHSFLFEWTVPSGVSFSTSTTSLITILPPNPPAKTSYSFSLEVFDSSGPADPGHNDMTYFTIPSTDFEMDPITVIKMLITGTEPTMLSNQTFSLEVSDASNAPAPGPILMSKTWTMPAGITFGTTAVSLLEIISPEVPTNPDYKFKLEFNDGFYTTNARHNGLTYHWTASGGIILSSDSDPYPTFIAPEVTTDTDYTFTLVVNNGFADSPPDQMKVTVKQVNKAPQANSGTDHSANEGATVTLDGSASSDPDGDVLTYKWTSVPGITLSSETDAKPTFTAPEVSSDTQYTFSLVVSDGSADSPADEVLITVLQVNKIPQANAGADHSANEGATVSLNGSASSDPDGDALTY
ncbi:MAG: PKD domain-containing protein, partial [Prolixibacteraceae bacterium]